MKILVSILFFLFSASVLSAQNQRPNILLIISDQHSGLLINQAGYPYAKTPGIDKLADNGVVFTRSYCTYPVCVASRASIITGMMPNKSHTNLTAYTSIGTVMKEAGYETAYFGKWHVSNSKMNKVKDWHGFDTYKDERDDSETERMTVDFLNEKHDVPFFLVTSFLNPHDCCELARNIAGIKDDYHDGPVEERMEVNQCPPLPANFAIPPNEPEGFYCRRTPDSTDAVMYGKHPVKYWGETEWRQYMYGYDRLVEKMDAHIFSLLKTLEKNGQLENTIVFYTSDHGDGHASHQWNQKMNFYEEVVNVPFVVSWKGHIKAGVIDKETLVASGIDLFPTICRLAGVSSFPELPGKDLSAAFLQDKRNEKITRDYVVSEINQTARTSGGKKVLKGRMVVSRNFKYFLFDGGENPEQLFDIKNDPGELNPVTSQPEYREALALHRKWLRQWITQTGDDFPLGKIPLH